MNKNVVIGLAIVSMALSANAVDEQTINLQNETDSTYSVEDDGFRRGSNGRRQNRRVCRRAGLDRAKKVALRKSIREFKKSMKEKRQATRALRKNYVKLLSAPATKAEELEAALDAFVAARSVNIKTRHVFIGNLVRTTFEPEKFRVGFRCVNKTMRRMNKKHRRNRRHRGGHL